LTLEWFYRYNQNPGTSSLAPDTMFYGPHWSNNFDIFVTMSIYTTFSPDSATNTPLPAVHIGDSSSGQYFQSDWSSDASIYPNSTEAESGIMSYVYNGGYYTYTDSNDNLYKFNPNIQVTGARNTGIFQTHTQRIARISTPNGYTKDFTYNSSGQLVNVTDSLGYAIVFDYNASGQITDACGYDLSAVIVAANTTCVNATLKVTYIYTNGELTGVTDVTGQTETYDYASPNPGYN